MTLATLRRCTAPRWCMRMMVGVVASGFAEGAQLGVGPQCESQAPGAERTAPRWCMLMMYGFARGGTGVNL